MSFFIKNKRKNAYKVPEKGKKTRKQKPDEEITSDEDSENETNPRDEPHDVDEEDDQETAQEKRVKLAKIYLEEIERIDDQIDERLKQDYLIETGRFRSYVADLYETPTSSEIIFMRNKYHRLSVTCLCLSSEHIFSGSKDGGLIKWTLKERKKLISIFLPTKKCVCLAISEDCKYLAVGDGSKDILIYSPETLEKVHVFRGHRSTVTSVVFRKTAPVNLYSASQDKSVKSWSMDELSYLETMFGHQDAITAIDALSKERAVTSGGTDHTLRVWKIPEESQLIFNGTGTIDAVKLINEDNFISGSDTGEIAVWSALKKKPLCSVKHAHGEKEDAWITSIATYVNTDLVATGSNDGSIRFWKLLNSCRNIEALFSVRVAGFVNCMAFTSDGDYLIAGVGQEHRAGRWSTNKTARNGICIIPLIKHVKK